MDVERHAEELLETELDSLGDLAVEVHVGERDAADAPSRVALALQLHLTNGDSDPCVIPIGGAIAGTWDDTHRFQYQL